MSLYEVQVHKRAKKELCGTPGGGVNGSEMGIAYFACVSFVSEE